MEGSTLNSTPMEVRNIPLPDGPPPPLPPTPTPSSSSLLPPSKKRARVEETEERDGYFTDPEEAAEEADYERRYMTSHFMGGKTAPTGDITQVQVKKIVVDVGERNMSRTVAVRLLVDGKQFLLPLDFLQKMNKYELETGETLYAPFRLWEAAAKVAEDAEEDLPSNLVKAVQKKTGLPTDGPEHPCPREKEMSIR